MRRVRDAGVGGRASLVLRGAEDLTEWAPMAAHPLRPLDVPVLRSLQSTAGNAAVVSMFANRASVQRSACCSSCADGGGCAGPAEEQALRSPVEVQRTVGDGHDLTSPRFAGDAKLEACYDDEARLTTGATGRGVSAVQQSLVELGYDLGPNPTDGHYGRRTWNAVKAFKSDQRLGWEHVGDVGPGTMTRLNLLFPANDDDELENTIEIAASHCAGFAGEIADSAAAPVGEPAGAVESRLQIGLDDEEPGAALVGQSGPGCKVPASWSEFTPKPGGAGGGLAAFTTPKFSASKPFTTELNKASSWVDTNQVKTGSARTAQVSGIVRGCEERFQKGASKVPVSPRGSCAAARLGNYTATTANECETVVGAGLDNDTATDAVRLLKHEQYHIKLACALANTAPSQRALLLAHATKKTEYDSPATGTDHGCNATQQAAWEAKIDSGTP